MKFGHHIVITSSPLKVRKKTCFEGKIT